MAAGSWSPPRRLRVRNVRRPSRAGGRVAPALAQLTGPDDIVTAGVVAGGNRFEFLVGALLRAWVLTAIPLFIYVTVIQGMAIGSAGPVPGTGPEMVVALATVAVVLADAFQPVFYLAVSGRQVICLRVEKNGYRPEHLVFAAPLPEVTVAARRRGLLGSRVRISVAGRRQHTLWLAGRGILGRQSAEVIAALQAGGAAVAGRSG